MLTATTPNVTSESNS